MLSASMMTWLTPIISDGLADGHQHAPQFLPLRAAGHVGKVLDLLGHLVEAQHRGAHHGRRCKKPRGKKRRHRIGPEQQQHWNEIGEGRYGLHEVERRRDQPLVHPRAAIAPDADQQAGHHAERDADDDQRQREHGIVPHAEDRQRQEAQVRTAAPAAAAGDVSELGHGEHDAQPRQARQRPGRFADCRT